ncbi:MAG: DNA internalization-related competence protein ComEC/Rec2 [Spiribacter salinus]|uniref:DNA internalization-related competence protein ComEC/Rec2 n=1 Tax=Spiribacter salinus TaxID=1335746 RepID=A0A540VU96_9GAMM|nr:MAG: DNA internalization-related competence protein ComEC/Rec2 [Spiribacter salinus]
MRESALGGYGLSGRLLAFLLGLLVAVWLPAHLGPWVLTLVLPLPTLALSASRSLPGWLAAGVLTALVWQAWALSLRPALELSSPVAVTGQVVDLPDNHEDRQQFLFAVEAIENWRGPLPRRIQVSIYDQRPRVQAGERWRLWVRLRRPRGYMNPVRFDYERWLAADGIDARGTLSRPDEAESKTPASGLPAWRARLSNHIGSVAGSGQGSALLQGLVVGDRRAFSEQTWEILRATGTSHLMAISGLHIGLVGGLGVMLGQWLWALARIPGARHWSGLVLGGIAATGYAALAGFALPTQRALIMFAVVASAAAVARRLLPGRALLLAAMLILTLDPAAGLSPGFWLSFSAVALIILVARGRRPGGPGALLRIQALLTLGLAPVSALFFGTWSPQGLIANLLVIPVFSFFIVPAALGATLLGLMTPGISAWGLGALARLLEALLIAGEWLDGVGPGLLSLGVGEAVGSMGALLAVGLMLLPRGLPLRWLAVPLCFPIALAAPLRPDYGEAWIDWLEVGQGNAAVIQTRAGVTVIDTGPAWFSGGNAATFTLKPFLEERGIRRLDRLVVTHADRDHRGGVETLREAFSIDQVMTGEPISALPGARQCVAGQRWSADGVNFAVLAPEPGRIGTGNEASCVVLVETRGGRVLFTGDTEGQAEHALARRLQQPVDVMEAPHHGSRHSTTSALLEAAKPDQVVVAAGYRNPYRMPDAGLIQRLRCRGLAIHDLGLRGALHVKLTATGVEIGPGARVRHGRWLNESHRVGRFQGGKQIHYHSRLPCAR